MANRYLSGNFAPVRAELSATDLEVTGEIPAGLDGRYLRIGPNPSTDPDPERYHWFLGDGMVHGVRLQDGAARWYRNRYVRSAAVAQALGEQPPARGAHAPDFAANTNVIEHAGRTLAIVEAGARPYELTDDLDTVGQCDFGGSLTNGYTAHPHEDPHTGELHAVSYNWLRGNRVEYTVLGTDATIRRCVEVEVGGSPMMHDFALTENYVVIYDLPVTFDKRMATRGMPLMERLTSRLGLAAVIGRNPLPDPVIARIARRADNTNPNNGGMPYSWDENYPARIGLLRREGGNGDVRWFEIDPCYVFHTLNAYEDGDTVVIDVVRHERMFATDFSGPNEGAASLARFSVDVPAGKVREERFDDHAQEFPRVDERLTGQRHRFGYAVGFNGDPGDAVIKHDLVSGRTSTHGLGAGRAASEFCFVPRSDAAAEDEGVLMGYVYDQASDRSDLVLLDAQTLEDVAAVRLPGRVPAGFHGNWAPTRTG